MRVFLKKFIPFIGLLFVINSCSVNKNIRSNNTPSQTSSVGIQKHIHTSQPINFKTGADNFENYIPLLKDKKVGVVSNQTGILTNRTHLVDFLIANQINVL